MRMLRLNNMMYKVVNLIIDCLIANIMLFVGQKRVLGENRWVVIEN